MPSPADEGSLTYALRLRGDDELQSGRLAPAGATAGELEALAKSRGDRLPLGLSNRLRGEIARRVRPDPAAEIEKTGQFVAEAILARLDAQEGRRDAAARRLELLAAKAAGSTSVRRQLALLRASAALAIATGSADETRRDLAAARDVAHNSGRLVEALELELEMAVIDLAQDRAKDGVAAADAVARQARELGLDRLAARARLLADAARQARR